MWSHVSHSDSKILVQKISDKVNHLIIIMALYCSIESVMLIVRHVHVWGKCAIALTKHAWNLCDSGHWILRETVSPTWYISSLQYVLNFNSALLDQNWVDTANCKCFIKENIRIWSFAESHSSVIADGRLHLAYVMKISLQFVHVSVCPIHNKSPLVKTSHYHSHWWPSSMTNLWATGLNVLLLNKRKATV